MGLVFADTDQAIEDELIRRLREVSPSRKLEMVSELGAAELGVTDLLERAREEPAP